jgi:cellulose synthase/poly-beta-1,6-N-acetylglucosamine synthase-like glycosyltransferase
MNKVSAIVELYLTAIGLFSIPIVAITVGYALFGLIKTRKLLALLALLVFLSLLFIPLGRYVLCFVGLAITVINNSFYLVYFLRSFRRRPAPTAFQEKGAPRVAVLIPAKDEEAVIAETLQSIAKLRYPAHKLEIIVIDDGSTDHTVAICEYFIDLIPHLHVVSNDSSKGKARSVNDVAATLESEYFVVLDADHHVDPHFLEIGLTHFADPQVACVQGVNEIRNGRQNLLCALVDMEYLGRYRGCYPGRDTAFFLGSGGIFKTEDFKAVGGFNPVSLTEDVEISFRLYDAGKTIKFEERIATQELAVQTPASFFWQRHRWMRGIWQTLTIHSQKLVSPNDDFRKVRLPILHFAIECCSLPALVVVGMFFVLRHWGWMTFPIAPMLYGALSTLLVFSVAYIRRGRYYLLALNPFLFFYIALYGLPAAIAWVDNVLLDKPYLWRKTGRPQMDEASREPSLLAHLAVPQPESEVAPGE